MLLCTAWDEKRQRKEAIAEHSLTPLLKSSARLEARNWNRENVLDLAEQLRVLPSWHEGAGFLMQPQGAPRCGAVIRGLSRESPCLRGACEGLHG